MPRVGFKHSAEALARMRRIQRARVEPVEVRFYRNVEFDTFGGCWLWAGAMPQKTGYGTMQHNGRSVGAHRISYLLHKGPIPAGLFVCHKCDVPACVNPDHLFLGTVADNANDMYRKGRGNTAIGEDHAKAKITEADVPKILARLLIGHSCAVIAADYGVTDCAINAIRRGKSWNHITGLPKVRSKVFEGGRDAAGDNPVADAA